MTQQQNKKSKRKKLILLAIMATACAGFALTASTYAWFTANRIVTVNDINVNVSSADGLQISVDGLNWKTIISNADITSAKTTYGGAVNQIPSGNNNMIPVSTAKEIDSSTGYMKMFSGSITGGSAGGLILTTAQSVEDTTVDTGDFVVFDLFLQVNAATDLYLTENSKVVAGNTDTGIQNAARIAIIDEGNVAAGSTAATIQGLKEGKSVYLWEPNSDTHTNAAIANAQSNYGVSGLANKDSAAVSYYGVKAVIPETQQFALSATTADYVTAITPNLVTKTADGISASQYKQFISLSAGITKIRVYMWIEGQDVDCEDNASGGSLTYSLQFSSNSKSPTA